MAPFLCLPGVLQVRTRDYTMTREERAQLVHCLRVAATTFDDNAQIETVAFRDRLLKQAADARALADRLAAAAYIHVGREVLPK